MLKLKIAVVASALLVSGAAFAGSHGVSGSTPGFAYHNTGAYQSTTGSYPGASGYAPGRASSSGYVPTYYNSSAPGAAGYAPGASKGHY